MKKSALGVHLVMLLLLVLCFTACNNRDYQEVVVYTSVDQVYSEKIFAAFENETGIEVKAVYDIEANKTVGLANRLEAEAASSQADVFWSGEILQTIRLKEKNIFEAIDLTAAESLPANFVDDQGHWFAFGGRARVMLYNKEMVDLSALPKTMVDLPMSTTIDQLGMAYPVFGTTNTEAACRYADWGEDKARDYYQSLKDAGIQVVDGNSVVKDFVSQKKLMAGLTDTDDALLAMGKNKALDLYFLDQGQSEMGAMVIPNSVAKVKDSPNPENAKIFMEYLLDESTEQVLVDAGWIHIPVHQNVRPSSSLDISEIKIMAVDFNQAYTMLELATKDMTEIFVR